jgi:hypothetical protein
MIESASARWFPTWTASLHLSVTVQLLYRINWQPIPVVFKPASAIVKPVQKVSCKFPALSLRRELFLASVMHLPPFAFGPSFSYFPTFSIHASKFRAFLVVHDAPSLDASVLYNLKETQNGFCSLYFASDYWYRPLNRFILLYVAACSYSCVCGAVVSIKTFPVGSSLGLNLGRTSMDIFLLGQNSSTHAGGSINCNNTNS